MRAGYFEAVGIAEFRDDMPEPQIERPDDVKIRIRCCGICGSEIHAFHGKHPFRIPPIVSGHEVAGDVVAAVGHLVDQRQPAGGEMGEPGAAAAQVDHQAHHLG